MADKLIFVVTCADEKPDKAIIPFALGNSALAMDAVSPSLSLFGLRRRILHSSLISSWAVLARHPS